MPKQPRPAGYELRIDRVVDAGQVVGGRVVIHLTAGSASLRLSLKPSDAVRVADGVSAAVREAGPDPDPDDGLERDGSG